MARFEREARLLASLDRTTAGRCNEAVQGGTDRALPVSGTITQRKILENLKAFDLHVTFVGTGRLRDYAVVCYDVDFTPPGA